MHVPFNKPTIIGNELTYIKQIIQSGNLSSDGVFTKQCQTWMEGNTGCKRAFLTTSCTHALEICALLADIKPGDEIIMPSFTFVSTANAFALRGARIVFIDIRPDTMNINEQLVECAITDNTKVIVPMHYAGISCEMDMIMEIAGKYGIMVVEDTAHGIGCTYKSRSLGAIGHAGCFSFDEAKNITCGEGGALLINEERLIEQSEVIRENGTDRMKFLRGETDKYSWQDIGSSCTLGEMTAAFLFTQLENAKIIKEKRLEIWNHYYKGLIPLEQKGLINLPFIPQSCQHNGHILYIKLPDADRRKNLINFLRERSIYAISHYVPLHSSRGGVKYGRFNGMDQWTTRESERLLRLPIYHGMSEKEIDYVISAIFDFFKEKGK